MRIRLARPESDLAGIAAVVNAFELEPVSIATVQQWFAYMPAGRITHRMVATNDHDDVIGYSVTTHEPSWPAHQFYVGWTLLRSGADKALAWPYMPMHIRFLRRRARVRRRVRCGITTQFPSGSPNATALPLMVMCLHLRSMCGPLMRRRMRVSFPRWKLLAYGFSPWSMLATAQRHVELCTRSTMRPAWIFLVRMARTAPLRNLTHWYAVLPGTAPWATHCCRRRDMGWPCCGALAAGHAGGVQLNDRRAPPLPGAQDCARLETVGDPLRARSRCSLHKHR